MASTVVTGSVTPWVTCNSSPGLFHRRLATTRTRRSREILSSPIGLKSAVLSRPRGRSNHRPASSPDDFENERPIEEDEEANDLGVKVALSMLNFYKREISPLMPKSCRYVPSCSEYSMQAYRKYGVIKGTVLTAWRICRCNPLGGSGFDPPRWFDETPAEPPS